MPEVARVPDLRVTVLHPDGHDIEVGYEKTRDRVIKARSVPGGIAYYLLFDDKAFDNYGGSKRWRTSQSVDVVMSLEGDDPEAWHGVVKETERRASTTTRVGIKLGEYKDKDNPVENLVKRTTLDIL